MGLMGGQLVITMVTASFLHKLCPIYSFGRWLLCGGSLQRYEHPSDEQLHQLAAGVSSGKAAPPSKRKNIRADRQSVSANGTGSPKEFTVPRSIDLQLEAVPVRPLSISVLRFYPEYQWLIDFAACTLVVYVATEVYSSFVPVGGELNLGALWCFLLCFFALKCLLAVNAIFWSRESSGEFIMCIVFGFFFLVLSMAVLVVNDDILEFGIEAAYSNFSAEATVFLQKQEILSVGPASLLTFRATLAVVSAVIGALLTFPGIRWAKTYLTAVASPATGNWIRLLLHIELGLPLLTLLLWVAPIARGFSARVVLAGGSDAALDVARIIALLGFVLLRFTLLRTHLQAYLDTAVLRVCQLRREAGRISNTELQRLVVQIYYYLCVVALQCVAPLLLLLALALLLKLLGGLRWLHLLQGTVFVDPYGRSVTAEVSGNASLPSALAEDSIAATAAELALTLGRLRAVFTVVFFRSMLQYLAWWTLLAWFTATLFGLLYHMYVIE